MKKTFNILLLIIICFLPIIVDAKATFEYKNAYINKGYITSKDGLNYFYNQDKTFYEEDYILVYNNEGELVKNDKFVEDDEYTYLEIANSDYYKLFRNSHLDERIVIEGEKIYYINYHHGDFDYYDYEGDSWKQFSQLFEDDEVFIRKLIGNRYNVYLKYKERRDEISNIYEYDSIYAIEIFDDDFYRNYMFLDNSLNFLFKLDDGIYIDPVIYSFDNLIYVINRDFNTENNLKIDIYRKDGVKIDTLLVDDILDYNVGHCGAFTPDILAVHDNYLYISYSFQEGCPNRIEMNDVSEFVKDQEFIYGLTLSYKLDYDIEKIASNNGDFTYEVKEDEDGKEYVELKINPKEGYMVDEIIVTDIYGDRIEITDNKFYKPMIDVKIEVQYREAEEYVPIPDTFLGKSFSLIIIGFILIGLGIYTINYVKN